MKTRDRILTVLFIFASFFTTDLNAQNFFTVISEQEVQPTAAELNEIDKIRTQALFDTLWFVEVDILSQRISNGQLALWLPDLDCTPVLTSKQIEAFDAHNYYWYGEVTETQFDIADSLCYNGTVTLISRQDSVFGSIFIHETGYELYALRPLLSILVKKNLSTTEKICDIEGEEGGAGHYSNKVSKPGLTHDPYGVCPIDVLALYTPMATQDEMNVEDRIETMIRQSNQALMNSDLEEGEIEFRLIDIRPVEFLESEEIDFDRTAIFPLVEAERGSADIVILFTGDAYDARGIAWVDATAPFAYCIVEIVTPTYLDVTAHELGHIFGALHQDCVQCDFWNVIWCGHPWGWCSDEGTIEHGYWFRTAIWPFSNRKHTIMFSGNEEEQRRRIQYFSNPDVTYLNDETGDVDFANVAEFLRSGACDVANFQDDGSPLFVEINAPHQFCNCAMTNVTAIASGNAPGLYTFKWYESTDGFNYGSVVSTLPSYSLAMPCQGDLFIRVDVFASNGTTATRFQKITGVTDESDSETPCIFQIAGPVVDDPDVIRIFPNPISNDLEQVALSFDSEDSGAGYIDIVSSNGELHNSVPINIVKGINNIELDVHELNSGIYFISVNSSTSHKVLKLIKLSYK